uniref:Uncharacterized protein n=1 Tax=Panagrolaimus sp. ES5 TaxID=591445 RepID=A0AC34FJE7_9BILA
MKAFIAFLLFIFVHFSVSIPINETEDYKKSKIEYDALIAKLNATDPCQLSFQCNDREECVNFPKCKNGEICPRTKCVPRKLCESTICPPGTECAEFTSNLGDLTEYKYNFKPMINYIGDTRGIRPSCVSRKVPSDGEICGENEEINPTPPLSMSENTCTIKARFGLVQPLEGPYVTYCVYEETIENKVTQIRGRRITVNPKKIKNFSINPINQKEIKIESSRKPYPATTDTPKNLPAKKRTVKTYPADVIRTMGPCPDCFFRVKDLPENYGDEIPHSKTPAKLLINAPLPNLARILPSKIGEDKNEEKYVTPEHFRPYSTFKDEDDKQRKVFTKRPKTVPGEILIQHPTKML